MISVGLAMIACDVGKTLGRAIESVRRHIQEIVVVDTGSEDDTKDVALKAGARVYDFNFKTNPECFLLDAPETWKESLPGPFTHKMRLCDFSAARQFSWDKATSDYLFWIDADDTVQVPEAIPEVVTDMRRHGVDAALLNYDYEHDDQGNVTMKLPRERIVRRGACRWEQPVHEVLVPAGLGTFYPAPNIVHHRGQDKLPPLWQLRNLKILLHWWRKNNAKDDQVDPRMLFYLALEERFLYPDQALKHFHLYNRRSGWDEERAMAHYLSGTLHERADRFHDALSEYSLARMEFKNNPDGLLGCARSAYYLSNWQKVIEWTEEAFEVISKNKDRPTLLMEDPFDRSWRPYVYLSAAFVNTTQYTKAIKICEEGLKAKPDEPHLIGNLKASRENLEKMSRPKSSAGQIDLQFRRSEPLSAPPMDIPSDVLVMIALQIWKRCETAEKKTSFIRSLPENLRCDEKIIEALSSSLEARSGSNGHPKENRIEPSKTPISPNPGRKLDIVIWTGPAWEKWSPASIQSGGIGGSETAAIYMARELSARGHDVRVIGTWDGKDGDVRYIDHQKITADLGQLSCDVFVTSRQPLILLKEEIRWKSSFIWAHDIHVGQSTDTRTAILRADKLLALSKWHADYMGEVYPFFPKTNISITRNGIDPSKFKPGEDVEKFKNGRRLIYSSSPDRGLMRLLQIYPRIREQVRDVELHVYYGFMNWKALSTSMADHEQLEKIAACEQLLIRTPGVVDHGRVDQEELADAFLSSKIWTYPTWFSETSCITAMEAQAAGTVPVTSKIAALSETVKHGVLLDEPDGSEEYEDKFVEKTVDMLLDRDDYRIETSRKARQYAMSNLSWKGVAQEWEEMFIRVLGEKQRKGFVDVPQYEGE